jgi:hypothetical protein
VLRCAQVNVIFVGINARTFKSSYPIHNPISDGFATSVHLRKNGVILHAP